MNIHQTVLDRVIREADILVSEEAALREYLIGKGALPARRPVKGEVWIQRHSKTIILITKSWESDNQTGEYICLSMSKSHNNYWTTSISKGWLDGSAPNIGIELYAENLLAAMERYATEKSEKARG